MKHLFKLFFLSVLTIVLFTNASLADETKSYSRLEAAWMPFEQGDINTDVLSLGYSIVTGNDMFFTINVLVPLANDESKLNSIGYDLLYGAYIDRYKALLFGSEFQYGLLGGGGIALLNIKDKDGYKAEKGAELFVGFEVQYKSLTIGFRICPFFGINIDDYFASRLYIGYYI